MVDERPRWPAAARESRISHVTAIRLVIDDGASGCPTRRAMGPRGLQTPVISTAMRCIPCGATRFTGAAGVRQVSLDRKPHTVEQIAAAPVDMFAEAAAERELVLESAVEPGLPPVECDFDRALQAVSSVVSNAIKVTAAGGSVSISARAVGPEVVVLVRDTGPGITPRSCPTCSNAIGAEAVPPTRGPARASRSPRESWTPTAVASGCRALLAAVAGSISFFVETPKEDRIPRSIDGGQRAHLYR